MDKEQDAIDAAFLTLSEIQHQVGLSTTVLTRFVFHGLIDPVTEDPEPRFAVEVIPRIRQIERLRRDLRINLAGVGVVLELLERIRVLEEELEQHRRR